MALAVTPTGVVTAFGLAPAAGDERPLGDALVAADRFGCYLADTGCASAVWEAHWPAACGATVIATPTRRMRRARPPAACTRAAGKRQVVEQVIEQRKDFCALERHRAKTLPGLLARLAAKVAAFTCGQWLNVRHDRPLRHFADLLI